MYVQLKIKNVIMIQNIYIYVLCLFNKIENGGGGVIKSIVYRFDCMCYVVYINIIYKMVYLYFIYFIVFVVYF